MKFNLQQLFPVFAVVSFCSIASATFIKRENEPSEHYEDTESNETPKFKDIQAKCFKENYFINAAGDVNAISDCSIISGSIYIKGFDAEVLDLGSISHIKGSFKVSNASSLLRIEGVELNTIDGTFGMDTLTSLTSVSFPKLETIDTIEWKVLPILSSVNLDKGIKSINSVVMSDTSLTGFGGFNIESLKVLNINNNRFLERIESSVKEVSDNLLISANARNLQVSLPNLTWAKTLTIKDSAHLNLNQLQIAESSVQFINNKFTELSLPKLKSVGSTLSIINNNNLRNIDFPSLTDVSGGLMVIDNDKIDKINFFPMLKAIGGAIEFQGDIKESGMKNLRVVKGSAIIKSSSAEFDCNKWMKEEAGPVVRGGKIECGSGDSKSTEVLLVDESGEITTGVPGVNSRKISEDSNSNASSVNSGSYTTFKVSAGTVLIGVIAVFIPFYL